TQDPKSTCPATAPSVITVGGSNAGESKYAGSDWGGRIDIFGPASTVPGAYIPNDFSTTVTNGDSLAAPHVVGVVAMYLHDHPTGTASLPSIVRQVIKSNADTCDWQGIQNSTCVKINNRHPEAGTADRLLYSSFLQAPAIQFTTSGSSSGSSTQTSRPGMRRLASRSPSRMKRVWITGHGTTSPLIAT